MQNTLAALSPHAALTEAISPAGPTEVTDGSFGDTFGEFISTSEASARQDETLGLGLVTPLVWGGFLQVSPDDSQLAEHSSGQGASLPGSENITDGAQVSTLLATVEAAFGLSIPYTPEPEISAEAPLADGTAYLQSAKEPRWVASGTGSGSGQPEPVLVALGKANETMPLTPVSEVTTANGDLETLSPGPAQPGIGKVDAPEFTGPMAPVNQKRLSESAAPVVDFGGFGNRPELLPNVGIVSQTGPATSVDMMAQPVNRSARSSGSALSLQDGAVQPKPVAPDPAHINAAETPPTVDSLPTAALQDLAKPAGYSSTSQGSAPLPNQVGHSQETSDLSGQEESGPKPSVVTFWERIFSDRSTLKHSEWRLQSSDPLTAFGPLQTAAMIEAASNALSEKGLSVASASGPLATEPAPELRHPPAPSASLTWSREQLGDLFTNTLTQWVFSDWQSALLEADQRPELSLSSLSVLSAGPASGTPTAGATGPQFPVPQIASQLAGVLVRNESSMTELALAPEELGKVRLRMEPDSANPDRITILISVERPETLDLFRRHAGELAEAMRNAGYSGADIGFGQNSQDSRPEHNNDSSPTGPGLPFEEVGPIETTHLQTLGVSLDLRL